MSNTDKINSFTQLNTWKEAHELVMMVYRVTKSFPKEEIFGLTNQIRRASVSITSNIAEGFSRQSFREKVQFYYLSLGSLTEVQNQLYVARDVGYLDTAKFDNLLEATTIVQKLLNGLIKSSKLKIRNS